MLVAGTFKDFREERIKDDSKVIGYGRKKEMTSILCVFYLLVTTGGRENRNSVWVASTESQ